MVMGITTERLRLGGDYSRPEVRWSYRGSGRRGTHIGLSGMFEE